MYNKHGMSAIVWSDLWEEYTEHLGDALRWPKNGTFDMNNVLKVEEQLHKRKARPGQIEAIEWWRKEAHRRYEKEQGKVEKALRMSEKDKQKQFEEIGREVTIERKIRENEGNIAGIYPLLPTIADGPPYLPVKEWPVAPEDPLLMELIDVPPPYFNGGPQMVAPIPPIQASQQPPAPTAPVFPGPPSVSQKELDSLVQKTNELAVTDVPKSEKEEAETRVDVPESPNPIDVCPHDPLNNTYPPLTMEGKYLAELWTKIKNLPTVMEQMNEIVEFMLRGGSHLPYEKVMLGRTKLQQGDIYRFILHLYAQYFKFKKLRTPKDIGELISKLGEEDEEETGEEAAGRIPQLLDFMTELRPKLKENTKHTRIGADVGTQVHQMIVRKQGRAPKLGSKDSDQQTEKDLTWFYEEYGPFTEYEKGLAKTAILWTSQPQLFNPDLLAQMYSELGGRERLIASIHMTQHLITLSKQTRPHCCLLESLLDRCTSPGFLQSPDRFLNIYLDARQEHYNAQGTPNSGQINVGGVEKNCTYGQYPIREVHPRQGANGDLERVFVYTPLTKLEIMRMKELVPPHSKDPVGFFKELTHILTMGVYTYGDLTQILQKTLPPGIYEKLRGQDWMIDNTPLSWTVLETADRDRLPGADIEPQLKSAPGMILKILQRLLTTRKEDWDAISACKQKIGEDVGDYYSRLEQCFMANSGLKLESESYSHLFVSKLVENCTPKLKERVQKVESSWQAQSPSQVLRILQYHQNRIREEEERDKNKMKETKMKALVAQTILPKADATPQAQRKIATTKGVCNYCKKPGHYVKDLQGNITCPVLKHNVATGKTVARVHAPREQQRTPTPTQKQENQTQMYMLDHNTEYTEYPEFPSFL
ncbi:hypothetical protein NDU88_002835 [Pleurodeles waltl]|uniref:Uncharacterized protein n=1 Tax=Pleurodeles waltl TaxID=8319 RepID=A0AAV7VCC2_PLEWA|nr:hypothetical protein NDU88_002835 [Pleurodeles waltl]